MGGRTVVLDASALTAAATGTGPLRNWFAAALEAERLPVVSAITLTEVTDGSARDARIRRIARRLRVLEVTEDTAYAAGAMRARVRRREQRDLTVDAVVAATAATLPGNVVLLTSDPADLTALLDGTDVEVVDVS